jgi:hypothetical protein
MVISGLATTKLVTVTSVPSVTVTNFMRKTR